MESSTRLCEALAEGRVNCQREATAERDGRPVCPWHAEVPDVVWQPAPDLRPKYKCLTCGGAGEVNFMGYGVASHLSNERCPACYGNGYVTDDPQ